jgi:hypothetical protein
MATWAMLSFGTRRVLPKATYIAGSPASRNASPGSVCRQQRVVGEDEVEFSGCVEPAGERFSQRESGGVGGFVDGRGPGDAGVRADQEGVGWSMIGLGPRSRSLSR